MCLAVPGKLLEIWTAEGTRMAKVDFGGVQKEICLEFVPDIEVGDYTIVHVGFALQKLDETKALETLALFQQMGEIDKEFGDPWALAAAEAGVTLDGVVLNPDLDPDANWAQDAGWEETR
jgi:hydrogenase expression/formation protein HypC